jgi:eukaryotic-like serine/threonine-protein kinase
MKECPSCERVYSDSTRFCPNDGAKLVESVQSTGDLDETKGRRLIPAPPEPLPMRLRIIDQEDEERRSRVIQGLVLDVAQQGMRVQTGTVETGELNIIRDHTIAFKNKLEMEVDLPGGTILLTGFAAWYKPVGDGINWAVGVYIRSMSAADRELYDQYLKKLSSEAGGQSAPAG